ncbi:hypothetical protein QJS10_CPB18g00717 [Acorus calamus]|uniref:Nuclease HARBI1 n=1 Tax=Acorus calamus TaxID=4465 RepID=A0AAV9CQ69_ACOCL|nr:hypothetical protein QJS10_CPB18g00717 [Acorus calamus]
MPNYSCKTQVKIVIAAIAIHNFIIESHVSDEVLNQFDHDNIGQNSTNDDGDSYPEQANSDDFAMSTLHDSIKDQIVVAHRVNHMVFIIVKYLMISHSTSGNIQGKKNEGFLESMNLYVTFRPTSIDAWDSASNHGVIPVLWHEPTKSDIVENIIDRSGAYPNIFDHNDLLVQGDEGSLLAMAIEDMCRLE